MKQRKPYISLAIAITCGTFAAGPTFAASLAEARVAELRKAELRDNEGSTLGVVKAVIVKKDYSEAGFILAADPAAGQPARFVYLPMDKVTAGGQGILLLKSPASATPPMPRTMRGKDFELVKDHGQTLADVLSGDESANNPAVAEVP